MHIYSIFEKIDIYHSIENVSALDAEIAWLYCSVNKQNISG